MTSIKLADWKNPDNSDKLGPSPCPGPDDLVVFDIDGTLADLNHRRHLVSSSLTHQEKNYKAFFSGVVNDTLIEDVAADFHKCLDIGCTVILASGRPCCETETIRGAINVMHPMVNVLDDGTGERTPSVVSREVVTIDIRGLTEKWLSDNGIVGYEELIMRRELPKSKADPYSSDVDVKQEILEHIIEKYGKKPALVWDDRPVVVRNWLANDIPVIDCGDGIDF